MKEGWGRRLVRSCSEEEQSSLECKYGFVPRKGKRASRERDCTVDCTDVAACLEMQRRAYWKEENRNVPDPGVGKGGSYGAAYRSRFVGVGGLEDVFASRRVLPSGSRIPAGNVQEAGRGDGKNSPMETESTGD